MNFKEQLKKDLDVFYNTEEFAVAALYKDKEIPVIFTDEYEIEGIEGDKITVKADDIPNIQEGDIFTIDGADRECINFEYTDKDKLEILVALDDN